ncbi:AGZA family xanthine/uracil permease-like MFS transporter [Salsuginibacillus halophilus]|uniref:AGZA family xanthine/uracil permease-like MFS transporter n=1 Tax=Salsuginibacillus halophilus TaxID=517424 RepID=A0A2P8HLB1_9BACI|nr:NCS2 family permease [Salsuginibacillus halophilus]PSL47004.1 AGZA family xanthine/uracil permease-like MFS transporter [Salsuginibacillus halophilus]
MKQYFQFREHETSTKQEFMAGLTTFLSMAYILFVNPTILADAGMDEGAVFTATALAAALGTLIMGVLARYPIALAPGMGLNAFFTYTVVINMGVPWEIALFGVFLSGIIFIVITLLKIRELIINAIPAELKYAAAAGIGLFIAFIGLQDAGLVVPYESTAVTLGEMTNPTTLLAVFGLLVTAILIVRGYQGGIFYGILLTSIAGIIVGLIDMPDQVVGAVPSLAPTFGAAFTEVASVEWSTALILQLLVVVLTFLFVDFFDTAGTLYAVANQAGFVKDNKLPRAGRALMADSTASSLGAVLGTSTTTAYVESTAGVAAGGRTGFTSVVTAGFFLLALFFSPLLTVVTAEVTAAALIIVGVFMASSLRFIDWKSFEVALPCFLTVVAMPLTFSIANGIALGFIFYPILMVLKGRGRELHPIMYVLVIIFAAYLGFLSE